MASSRFLTSTRSIEGKLIANNLSQTQVHQFLSQLLLHEGLTFSDEQRNNLKAIIRNQNGTLSYLTWKTQNGHGIHIQRNSETNKYSIMFGQDKSGIFYPMIQRILKCVI